MLWMPPSAARLPEELRQRHAAYLIGQQANDGGWAGRRGTPDCYYTLFALAGLALLERLEEPVARRAAAFLEGQIQRPAALGPVDFLASVASSLVIDGVIGVDVFAGGGRQRLESLRAAAAACRRPDGGYAKTPRGPSSTYHTFLVTLCRRMLGDTAAETPDPATMVLDRRRPDGGFVELAALRHGGTNPTAAALLLLKIEGRLDPATADGATQFLAAMQTADGGIRAHAKIPVADLLSTCAAAVALAAIGRPDAIDPAAASRFIQTLELPHGGYRGGAWDTDADVEYAFYGLLARTVTSSPAGAVP